MSGAETVREQLIIELVGFLRLAGGEFAARRAAGRLMLDPVLDGPATAVDWRIWATAACARQDSAPARAATMGILWNIARLPDLG